MSACTTAPAEPDAGAGSGTDPGAEAPAEGTSLDCSAATTAGYDLFVDPALTIEPQLDVYPLEAGDTISFTYSAHDEAAAPSYGWLSSYITSDGAVAPSTGSFFFEEEGGVFVFEGPEAIAGVDGGPYTGFLEIESIVETGTTVIARLCVQFALTE